MSYKCFGSQLCVFEAWCLRLGAVCGGSGVGLVLFSFRKSRTPSSANLPPRGPHLKSLGGCRCAVQQLTCGVELPHSSTLEPWTPTPNQSRLVPLQADEGKLSKFACRASGFLWWATLSEVPKHELLTNCASTLFSLGIEHRAMHCHLKGTLTLQAGQLEIRAQAREPEVQSEKYTNLQWWVSRALPAALVHPLLARGSAERRGLCGAKKTFVGTYL